MPLAYYGNGSGDWSSTFASLADGVIAESERLGARLDQRREDELAAKDTEAFARYQAGQMTDDEWLAYIRNRKNQTSYDPTQHANWRKAELEWGERIADDKAQAAFERTGNYGDYIGYLEGKLKGTKDSDGRLGLTKQIRDLRDALAQRDFQRGVTRIQNQIKLGDATQEDLLRFYRETRRGLRSNSPLYETVQDGIGTLRANIASQKLETDLARVDFLLGSQQLTPKEAGARKMALLNGSSLMATDPTRFYAEMDAATKLSHTPDPARMARLYSDFVTGNITPAEYETRMNRIADSLMDYDMASALKMRQEAFSNVDQLVGASRTASLSDPGSIRVGKGGVDFQWISQMDGTRFAATNCTMASGAMLAYAMGYKNLSGGDLRYLTGDTVGGTNVTQLYNALNRAGVDTSGMDLKYSGTFQQFKNELAKGRSSVIVGDNAMVGSDAKASASMNGMHAWLVAQYDPKRDAFLVYNSAMGRGDKRSKDGYWVSADTMQAFGFSGRASGSWLAAPRGTAGKQRRAWHVIDVDTPPQRPNTPKSYKGRDNPGIAGAQRGATRATGQEREVSKDDYDALKQRYAKQLDQSNEVLDAYKRGETEWDQSDGTTITLTPEIVDAIDSDVLDQYDSTIAFADDNGDTDWRRSLREQRGAFVADVRSRNGARTVELANTLIRDAAGIIDISQFDGSAAQRGAKADAINAMVQAFVAAGKARSATKDPLDDDDADTQGALEALGAGMEAMSDPNLTMDQKRQVGKDLSDRLKGTGIDIKLPDKFSGGTGGDNGDAGGRVVANVGGWNDDRARVEDGTGVEVGIPHYDADSRTWVTTVETVPASGGYLTKTNPQTGQREAVLDPKTGQPIPLPDLSGVEGVNHSDADLMWVPMSDGKGGIKVTPVASFQEPGWSYYTATQDDPAGRFRKGDTLDQATLDQLSPRERKTLEAQGVIKLGTMPRNVAITPGFDPATGAQVRYVRDDGLGGTLPDGTTDTGTGSWYVDRLPTQEDGDAIPGLTDVVGAKDGRIQLTFPGGVQGQYLPLDPSLDPNRAQQAMDRGDLDAWKPEDPRWHDDNGDLTGDQTYDDSGSTYWTPLMRGFAAAAGMAQQWKQQQAAKAADAAKAAARAAMERGEVADQPSQLDQQYGDRSVSRYSFDPMSAILGNGAGGVGPRQPAGPATPPAVPDILGQLADSFGVRKPRPQPSRGDIPRPVASVAPTPPPRRPTTPVNPVRDRKVLADSLRPKPARRFVPPSPSPTVRAAQTAAANSAVAKAKAAAAKAAQSTTSGGGIFGTRRV